MKTVRANKKVKKGDMVRVIAGRSKNKTGQVSKVLLKTNMCLVEKVNMVKKHAKPTQENPQGGIIEKEGPIHLSNVVLIDDQKPAKKTAAKKTTAKKAAPKKKAAKKKTTAKKKEA
jgi:large subunit ribosomal protein L24